MRTMVDARIDRLEPLAIQVSARAARALGEQLAVEAALSGGERLRIPATITSSMRTLDDGFLRHKLGLALADPIVARTLDLRHLLRDVLAVTLVADVTVRIVDVSRSGCLLASHQALTCGIVGVLAAHPADESVLDLVRVCRIGVRKGAAYPYLAGAEFLVLGAAVPAALRHTAFALEQQYARVPLVAAGDCSGLNLTTNDTTDVTEPSVSCADACSAAPIAADSPVPRSSPTGGNPIAQ